MKLFSRLFLILGITLAGWSSVAWGYTGWCTAVNGTQTFTYNFGSMSITDASQNVAGKTFLDAYTWNLGTTFNDSCDADPSIANPLFYYSASTDLPLGHNDGSYQFYKINDYLEVATSVWLAGTTNTYVATPWIDITSGAACDCSTYGTQHSVGTGSQGKLSLYISKPFVGTVTIPTVNVVNTYISTVKGSYSPEPMSSVYISGQVIVPQTCSVNAGQIVTVDFGSFMSGEFKNKGQMPAGYTPKTITVPIKCNGMDANASLTLRFQGEASADEPAAIKTSNDDVGVQITDDSGKVIEPNSGLLPFQLDDNLQATVTFHAAPISTTGNAPAEGTFSATAYIRVDFA